MVRCSLEYLFCIVVIFLMISIISSFLSVRMVRRWVIFVCIFFNLVWILFCFSLVRCCRCICRILVVWIRLSSKCSISSVRAVLGLVLEWIRVIILLMWSRVMT